ncbi:MAG: HEAT repeat domain-containing protein [Burkholderiaceae bacterium]|nr:HEAT repeat domain-containing protein [Burkholderiaceae bacterium]
MFDTISDPALRLAAQVGLTALALTLAMTLMVIAMRVRDLHRTRRQHRTRARWRPVLVRAAIGEAATAPRLLRHERMPLLLLWIQMQESLRGEAHERLNRLGDRLGLYALARRLERSHQVASRVLGHATLGHFAHAGDWQQLDAGMQELHNPASLAAARALLRIDASSAAPRVLDRYLLHSDWPAPRVGTLLRDTPHEAIGASYAKRLFDGSLYEQLRLLPLLRFAEVPNIDSLLDRLVHTSREPQVLAIALRQLQGPAALADVRRLSAHGDPLVRSAAAQALGRIGTADDQNRLMDLLVDGNWWVRYRAAQALVGMPGVEADDMVQLRRLITDRYARDMLDQVLAERSLAAQGLAA